MSVIGDVASVVEKGGKRIEEVRRKTELTKPPPRVKESFLYRDKLVDDLLHEIVAAKKTGNKNKFLLSGLGGVGKTAVAWALYHQLKKRCKKIGWVECRESGNLRDSLLAAIHMYEEEEDKEKRFQKITNYLLEQENNTGETILFLDNVDWPDALLKSLTGYDITLIVTSRMEKMGGYITWTIDPLNEDQCVEIFSAYYPRTISEHHETVVRKLVRMVSCHTMSVELLAKSVPPTMTLTEYQEALEMKGFGLSNLTFGTDHDQEEHTMVEHLKKLFYLTGLGDENTLKELVNTGWLTQMEDENSRVVYVVHPIVRKIVLLDPVPEKTIAYFKKYVRNEEYLVSGMDARSAQDKAKTLRSVLVRVEKEIRNQKACFSLNINHDSLPFEKSMTFAENEDRLREIPKNAIKIDSHGIYLENVYFGKKSHAEAEEYFELKLENPWITPE